LNLNTKGKSKQIIHNVVWFVNKLNSLFAKKIVVVIKSRLVDAKYTKFLKWCVNGRNEKKSIKKKNAFPKHIKSMINPALRSNFKFIKKIIWIIIFSITYTFAIIDNRFFYKYTPLS